MRKEMKKGFGFIFLAFVIPLVCIGFMRYCSVFQTGLGNLFLYGIEGASPTIAAFLVAGRNEGVKAFFKKKVMDNLSFRCCILGMAIPLLILTMGKAVSYFALNQDMFFHSLSMKKLLIISWALIAEELGWRGFLQEWLEKYCKAVFVPLIAGVIWALWHYHFVLAGTMEIPYFPFLCGCIFESYGYYVMLKIAKGNVVPVCIWHFTGNLFFNIYRIDPSWNQGSLIPYYIVNTVYCFYVITFVLYRKKLRERRSK